MFPLSTAHTKESETGDISQTRLRKACRRFWMKSAGWRLYAQGSPVMQGREEKMRNG